MDLIPNRKREPVNPSEKRAFKRINANVEARFFYGNIFYSGTVLNMSEKGMFINTKRCLPYDSMFVIIIREDSALLKVIAKVRRYSSAEGCDGMGVELISPSADYMNFIYRLKVGV